LVDVGILNKFEWRYLIVDEGHRLKNKSAKLLKAMQTLNCDRRLLLTGTPIQVGLTAPCCCCAPVLT